MSEVVNVALIGAFAACVAALTSWAMNASTNAANRAHQDDWKQKDRDHDAQIALLNARLASSEQRLRGEISRDLAANESALRVAGEIELRLIASASESLAQSVQMLAQAYEVLLMLSAAIETNAAVDAIPFDTIQAKLLHTGVFLPPELDRSYMHAAETLGIGITEISETRKLDSVTALSRREEIEANAGRLVFGFREQASAWKMQAWEKVRRPHSPVALPGLESARVSNE